MALNKNITAIDVTYYNIKNEFHGVMLGTITFRSKNTYKNMLSAELGQMVSIMSNNYMRMNLPDMVDKVAKIYNKYVKNARTETTYIAYANNIYIDMLDVLEFYLTNYNI